MLTLVIPTKNRAAFILRALRYYSEVGCPFPVLIGDSSDGEQASQVERAVEALRSRLNVRHVLDQDPGSGSTEGWWNDRFILKLAESVQTPYAAFFSDDDFPVLKRLPAAVDFLEANKDFSFVSGKAALCFLKSGTLYGQVQFCEIWRQQTIHEEDPCQRLRHWMTPYSVLEFGVSRTEQLKARFKKVFQTQAGNQMGELMNGALTVIQGKVKAMEELFLIRQVHPQQFTLRNEDLFDWLVNPNWPALYASFRDCLVEELTQRSGMVPQEAERIVKEAFWFYLATVLQARLPGRKGQNGRGFSATFRRVVERLPGMRGLWHTVRPFLPGEENKMVLSALLRPSFPYHADFMPIYRILTTPPGEVGAPQRMAACKSLVDIGS